MGYSKSEVKIMEEDGYIFVRKSGDIQRNLERYDILSHLELKTPQIYEITEEYYDMEYIKNFDIIKYLSIHPAFPLANFLINTIDKLSENSIEADYSKIYFDKLNGFNFGAYNLPFTANELISKLPKFLPMSEYHGDMTLQNILYDVETKDFVLIDPLTTEYSSYVFDLAKLRQDITCKWFIRNEKVFFDPKLQVLDKMLSKYEYYNNDYLLILMLLRVLPYTKTVEDETFLRDKIILLWK
jgi:hypothetical protein